MEEINDVRIHPRLFDKPIVVVSSESIMTVDQLRSIDVHQIDEVASDGFVEVAWQVRSLLDRIRCAAAGALTKV